jgi:hypothetical protein
LKQKLKWFDDSEYRREIFQIVQSAINRSEMGSGKINKRGARSICLDKSLKNKGIRDVFWCGSLNSPDFSIVFSHSHIGLARCEDGGVGYRAASSPELAKELSIASGFMAPCL